MQGSLKLGKLAGIELRVHYTWLIAFVLIAWSLAQGYFPLSNAGLETGTYWILGVVSALLLFGSVLVHELGHSLLAAARGLRVQSITLFIFGGVSSITKEASTAKDEFLIAVIGPLTSLVLAGLFWLIGQVVTAGTAIAAVAGYLAFTNLLLAAFNLVPGFPLDGGRVLRSILWGQPVIWRELPGSLRMSGRQSPSPTTWPNAWRPPTAWASPTADSARAPSVSRPG